MKTIALINNKGGVGKTTVAINLSAYLASKQLKVLLIDLDWQRSAGLSLGFGRNPEGITIADILFNNKPVKQGIRNTNIKNIDIIISLAINYDYGFYNSNIGDIEEDRPVLRGSACRFA